MSFMGARFATAVSEQEASVALATIRDDLGLEVVSYGPYAVDLQLPDAPSPHAVNVEASYSGGSLRIVFHTSDDEARRIREALTDALAERGIALRWRSEP
jgi:hypothetical protein